MVRLVLIYILGAIVEELFQWAAWGLSHPAESPVGYWKVGRWHLVINWTVVAVCGVLWYNGLLGPVVDMLGGTPIAQLLTVSPPFGFLLALLSDILGDKIAYAARVFLGRKFPAATLAAPEETKP